MVSTFRALLLLGALVQASGQMTVDSGAEFCVVDGNCVHSLGYPEANYAPNAECLITPTAGIALVFEFFEIEGSRRRLAEEDKNEATPDREADNERKLSSYYYSGPSTGNCPYDYLEIDGIYYCQNTMPPLGANASAPMVGLTVSDLIVPSGAQMKFHSDGGVEMGGWRLCQIMPPAPPAVPFPPSPPPSPSLPPSCPPSPPPPAPPPGFCTNTCDDTGGGNAGVCNDGADGDPQPVPALCPFGSDCADCAHISVEPLPVPCLLTADVTHLSSCWQAGCASSARRAPRLARSITTRFLRRCVPC